MNLLQVSSFALLLLLVNLSHHFLLAITPPNSNSKMTTENTFLFTSESVNEGHPGT
jgi:hypothetical protein